MNTHTGMFTSMEDRALLDAARRLVIEEHLATAALLRALMEIDTRRRWCSAAGAHARGPPAIAPEAEAESGMSRPAVEVADILHAQGDTCLLYTSPSPRDS